MSHWVEWMERARQRQVLRERAMERLRQNFLIGEERDHRFELLRKRSLFLKLQGISEDGPSRNGEGEGEGEGEGRSRQSNEGGEEASHRGKT